MRQFASANVVEWVAMNVLPFEAELRARLRKICKDTDEVDDVVQEIYCRILKLDSIDKIYEARGYVMQMARNILIDQYRRESVVDIQAVASLDELDIEDPRPCPEQVVMARAELRWVLGLVSNLPDRCKQVFCARKIYGLSQLDTAESLGLSENVVEKET